MQRHKVIGHRSLRLSQFLLSLNTLPLNVQQIGQRCRPGALPLLSQIESSRGSRLCRSQLDYVLTFSTVAREGSLRILQRTKHDGLILRQCRVVAGLGFMNTRPRAPEVECIPGEHRESEGGQAAALKQVRRIGGNESHRA
jgi:hypothetical protein